MLWRLRLHSGAWSATRARTAVGNQIERGRLRRRRIAARHETTSALLGCHLNRGGAQHHHQQFTINTENPNNDRALEGWAIAKHAQPPMLDFLLTLDTLREPGRTIG